MTRLPSRLDVATQIYVGHLRRNANEQQTRINEKLLLNIFWRVLRYSLSSYLSQQAASIAGRDKTIITMKACATSSAGVENKTHVSRKVSDITDSVQHGFNDRGFERQVCRG